MIGLIESEFGLEAVWKIEAVIQNPLLRRGSVGCLSGFWRVKQAGTGQSWEDKTGFLPALQVEQVKRSGFEVIYEDNACLFKPYSNEQNRKSVVEFLFLKASQNAFCQEKTLQDTFNSGLQRYPTDWFAIL